MAETVTVPAATNSGSLTSWPFANNHVDSSIKNTSFTSSAYTVVYVKVKSDNATAGTTVFRPIGLVQNWAFAENRQVDELCELGSDTKYLVPGRTTGQINISRFLIDGADLINTMYNTAEGGSGGISTTADKAIASLKDISGACDLMFVIYQHATDSSGAHNELMVRYFDNCWIVARQESVASNQTLIAENITVMYENLLTSIKTVDSQLTGNFPDAWT